MPPMTSRPRSAAWALALIAATGVGRSTHALEIQQQQQPSSVSNGESSLFWDSSSSFRQNPEIFEGADGDVGSSAELQGGLRRKRRAVWDVFGGKATTERHMGVGVELWDEQREMKNHGLHDVFLGEMFLSFSMSMSMSMPTTPMPTISSMPTTSSMPTRSSSPTMTPVPTMSPVPTTAPTMPPITPQEPTVEFNCTDPDDREEFIREQIAQISSEEDLNDPTSPQYKAQDWLIYNDTITVANPCTYPTLGQRYALAVFYFATDGPSWDESTGWLTEENECDWYGLNCFGVDLIDIELESNLLDGFVPPEISQFPELLIFAIFDNKVVGELPSTVEFLTKLQVLDIEQNEFVGNIFTPELLSLTTITKFRVSFNNLTGEIPDDIAAYTELEEFWAANNSYVGEIPNVFSEMPQLMEIRLYNNTFVGPIPDVPDTLTVLDVSYNELEGEIPLSVYDATGLTDLILKDNNLVGSIRDEIGDLTQLEELWLNFNNFTGRIPDTIASLTQMVTFLLEMNKFDGEFPDVFDGYTELDFFDIGDNKFSGPIPESIFGVAPIRIVYMSNNTFTGALPNFSQAQSLKDLWVNGNMLNGTVPDMNGPFVNFTELLVNNNDLTGSMPDSICQLRNQSEIFISLHADCAPDPFPDGPIELLCDCCTQCFPIPPNTTTP